MCCRSDLFNGSTVWVEKCVFGIVLMLKVSWICTIKANSDPRCCPYLKCLGYGKKSIGDPLKSFFALKPLYNKHILKQTENQ